MKIGRNDPCPCGSGKKFKKCCIDKPEYSTVHSTEFVSLITAIESGKDRLESGDEASAAREWLPAWKWLLEYAATHHLKSLLDVDIAIRKTVQVYVSNWVQDLEACLGNLAMRDDEWANARLNMIRQLLQAFPDTSPGILFDMREAAAETLFILGRFDEADGQFEDLVRDYPMSAWAYIGWGDMYSPAFFQDRWTKDPQRARDIYERGLNAGVTEERDELTLRIRLLGET